VVAVIVFFILHWYLSLFSQTFFLHRYSAHKMFLMNPFWERFFFLFTYITQGTSYLSPRAYAVLHRMHHAYSDTEKDPHTPHHTRNLFTMMWKTREVYNGFVNKTAIAEARFDGNVPLWNSLESMADTWWSRLSFGAMYVVFYMYFVPENAWFLFLVLPFHFLMGPVHGAIVNWFGHKTGYQNFDNNDKSRNSVFFADWLMMGELFQNNHHKLPNRLNFAAKWWELDPSYPVIKLLMIVGIIRPKSVAVTK
jgi:stearoyl-CoA desaturase (Delta-9 desaturase)